MKPQFPSDEQDKFMVRFPHGMRDEIKSAANENGRSMNSEIIARLGHSLRTPPAPDDDFRKASEALFRHLIAAGWTPPRG